jgi:hypothetical protein
MSRGPASMTGRTRFRDVRFRDMPEVSGWLRHYGGGRRLGSLVLSLREGLLDRVR